MAAPPPAPVENQIDFDHLEDTTLFFKASGNAKTPKPLKTGLYDLKYLGPLRPSGEDAGAPPYFLFTGRPCKDCLQDIGIYAIRSTGGRPAAYVYPGKIFEHKSRSMILESRGFYGRCLARESGSVYLVYQKEHIDRRHGNQSSVFIAEPGADHMDERLIERHLPRLQDTLKLVKAKACHEIEGRNRLTATKPLDIDARHAADTDDDDPSDEDGKDDADAPPAASASAPVSPPAPAVPH